MVWLAEMPHKKYKHDVLPERMASFVGVKNISGTVCFTQCVPQEALRFSRKKDAESFIWYLQRWKQVGGHEDLIPTEHSFTE